jgi:hypothetical protein
MGILIILAVLAAAGTWLAIRVRAQVPTPSSATQSLRVTNPRLQGAGMSRLWQLHNNGCRCEVARQLAGRRLDIDDTVPLRLFGGSSECRCHYRPLNEARRTPRRNSADRRDQLRFDLCRSDRRMRQDRRQHRDGWERQTILR